MVAPSEKQAELQSQKEQQHTSSKKSRKLGYIETFCFLTQTYEGRDKFVKLFQYYTKFCSWFYLNRDSEAAVNFFLVSGKYFQL